MKDKENGYKVVNQSQANLPKICEKEIISQNEFKNSKIT